MNEHTVKPPTWYWVVAGLALLWNLMGCWAFWGQMTMTEAQMAMLPAAQQELINTTPAWVNAAFAVAVFGGALGSALLLMRKRLAVPVFLLSLLGVLGQQLHMLLLSDTMQIVGMQRIVLPLIVLAIAIFLLWFSRRAAGKGWLS